MKRRNRYLFLGIGFVFFLIGAPLLVFFVGGIRYNFGANEYDKTGILSVVTDPKDALVTLDDKLSDTSSANFRFLDPKEYNVIITKDGYWEWSKRLEVKPGKVTIASNSLDKIYLLKKNQSPLTISDGVLDFYTKGSKIIYLTNDSVNLISDNSYDKPQVLSLSGEAQTLLASPHGNYFLLLGPSSTLLLNVDDWSVSNISDSVSGLMKLQVTDSGQILGLRGITLILIDGASKKTTVLLSQVDSFNVLAQNLYYTQTKNDQTNLALVPLDAVANATPQIIFNNLPAQLATAQLLITEQKDVLLLSGSSLYKVNASLDLISDSVKEIYFDPLTPTLLIASAAELYWYDFPANKHHLITRNTQGVLSPQLSTRIGYGFYLQNGTVMAMELDDRDRQNNYSLLPVGQGQLLRLDPRAENLYFLDGQKLEVLNIR